MPSLADILAKVQTGGAAVLSAEPTTVDDELVRLVVVAGDLWMRGVEPVAAEMDRLTKLLTNKKDPALKDMNSSERTMVTLLVHQLRKVKEEHAKRNRIEAQIPAGT